MAMVCSSFSWVDNHGRDEEVIVEAGKCVKGLVEMIFGDIKVGWLICLERNRKHVYIYVIYWYNIYIYYIALWIRQSEAIIMKKRCCSDWVGLLKPVRILMWWWARDINMQRDLMQHTLGPVWLQGDVGFTAACRQRNMQHGTVHVYLFFCTHSASAMVLTPVLFVDSREWSYCHFDTSSLWGLTSLRTYSLSLGKWCHYWDMLNSNTHAIKHLNMSCHLNRVELAAVSCCWHFFRSTETCSLEFWQPPRRWQTA